MPDSHPKDPNEEPTKDSVDLSDLKSFSFGTQWTEASKSSDSGRSRGGRGGPRGGDRSARRSGGGPPRKDRRPPRPVRPETRAGEGPAEAGRPDEQGGRRPGRRGPRFDGGNAPFRPYESPVFDVCFYPEDSCFSAIIKAMRTNHLTYELFHVAKLFMEKPDRFIASITRKAEKGAKPEKVHICAIDSMPFETEEEVLSHAMAHHADAFFEIEEVEVEPPSGNFPFVNRCPFTKELLGPPNYHKYEAALRNHHRTRLPHMSFEKLQSSMETVRDEDVVNQWLESQKKATRYTTKPAEGEEPKSFESVEGAMGHLRTELGQKVAKLVNYARVHGTVLERYKDSEAYKAMDGERQRQLRFPLDTANAIRGRMRREKFSIYKKGSKGVTYVCSTKRNFRTPGQVMSPALDRIIRFLEANQLIKAKDMPPVFEAWLKDEGVEAPFDEKKLHRDLHWLVADGYVSHFEDDTLFAQPELDAGSQGQSKPQASPKKKDKEAGEKTEAATAEAKPAEGSSESEKPAAGALQPGEAAPAAIASEEPSVSESDEKTGEVEAVPTEATVDEETTTVAKEADSSAEAIASQPESDASLPDSEAAASDRMNLEEEQASGDAESPPLEAESTSADTAGAPAEEGTASIGEEPADDEKEVAAAPAEAKLAVAEEEKMPVPVEEEPLAAENDEVSATSEEPEEQASEKRTS